MNIIITGGAGFIGGNFVQYILDNYQSYKVFNLDNLTYAGDLTKHSEYTNNKNYSFHKVDIANKENIADLFRKIKPDFVVHFAAESHVDRSITDPDIFLKTNIIGTQRLLEASLEVGVKKFLHVSTDEVYGELDFNPDNLFTEESPIAPNSPYSASKASSDLLVRAYHETYNLPINITRCSNNYGPFHFPEKLIPLTISKVLKDEKIPVYGKGDNVRDWLHVYDHCTAIDKVLHNGVIGEVYNVGGHNERSNLQVVRDILEYFNKNDDSIQFVEDRLGHDRRYAINPDKLMDLGWKSIHDFETGLKDTIEWYLSNGEWLTNIENGNYRIFN